MQELVQPDVRGILSMGTRWVRGTRDAASVPAREGGIVDPAGLERLIETSIPFPAIDGNLPAFGSAEIAAAMPGARDDALKAVDSQLTIRGHTKTERALETQVALRELQDRCPARMLERAVRLDQALAAARSCDHEIVADIRGSRTLGREVRL